MNIFNNLPFKIVSLKRVLFTIIIAALQLYLISNRLVKLNEYNASKWASQSKTELILYTIFIVFALILTIIYLIFGCIKLRNYSHDEIQLGKDFDYYTKVSLKRLNETYVESTRVTLWKRFLPLGAIIHLLVALLILLSDLVINSKRIQVGVKPIGDVFGTKIDFLFGDTMSRINKKSIDDYSTSQSTLISIDILNLIISLVTITLQTTQIFWSTNKFYCLILTVYTLNWTLLGVVSYSAYEIIFKCSIYDALKNQLILNQNILSLVYFFSSILLLITILTFSNFGFSKYERLVAKFYSSLNKFLVKKSNDTSECASSESSTLRRQSFWSTYKDQLTLSILFLVYSVLRSLFIYEIFTIIKYTNDSLMICSLVFEFLTIILWVVFLLFITIKVKWNFRLSSNYKLLCWNLITQDKNEKGLLVRDDSTTTNRSSSSSSSSPGTEISTIIPSYTHSSFDETSSAQQKNFPDCLYSISTTQKLTLDDTYKQKFDIETSKQHIRSFSQRLPKKISFQDTKNEIPHLNIIKVKQNNPQKAVNFSDSSDSGRDSLSQSPNNEISKINTLPKSNNFNKKSALFNSRC